MLLDKVLCAQTEDPNNIGKMWVSDFPPPKPLDNNCDPHATCTDTLGSFTCACTSGYEGDGVTCTGKFINKT